MQSAWLLPKRARLKRALPVLKDLSDLQLLYALNGRASEFTLDASDQAHACASTGWLDASIRLVELPEVPPGTFPFMVGGAACGTLSQYLALRGVAEAVRVYNVFLTNPTATSAAAVEACLAALPEAWPVLPKSAASVAVLGIAGMRKTVAQFLALVAADECAPGAAAWQDGVVDVKQVQADTCLRRAAKHMTQLDAKYDVDHLNHAVAWSDAAVALAGKSHKPTTIARQAASRTRTVLTPATAVVAAELARMTLSE